MNSQREYLLAWAAITRMLADGRSLSGRERNNCFINLGDAASMVPRFADASALSGFDFDDDARAMAISDWDFDGDLDLWVLNRTSPQLRFLRNQLPADATWFSIRLTGTTCNRDAIGARVEVQYANEQSTVQTAVRTVRAGQGFLSQSTKTLHFGLGQAARILQVRVRWPDGRVATFGELPVNVATSLVQGDSQPTVEVLPEFTAGQEVGQIGDTTVGPVRTATEEKPTADATLRIVLAARPVMPELAVTDLQGTEVRRRWDEQRPQLVNVWGLWCPQCLVELNEFAQRHDELKVAGLNIHALNIAGPDERPGPEHRARMDAFMKRIHFPFDVAALSEDVANELNTFQRACFSLQEPMPAPTSFLLDRNGLVAVIYKGQVSVDQVLDDLALLEIPPSEWRERAVPFSGRWLNGPVGSDPVRLAMKQLDDGSRTNALRYLSHYLDCLSEGRLPEADPSVGLRQREPTQVHYTRGRLRQQAGDLAGAAEDYQQALVFDAENHRARQALGHMLLDHGSAREAATHLKKVVEYRQDDTDALCLLSMAELKAGNIEQAIVASRQAVQADHRNATAHYTLALALDRQGVAGEAIAAYRAALEIDPGWAMARNNLAWLLVTVTDSQLRDAQQALRLVAPLCRDPERTSPLFLRTYAAALATDGQHAASRQYAELAIERAQQQGMDQLAAMIRAESQRYASPNVPDDGAR